MSLTGKPELSAEELLDYLVSNQGKSVYIVKENTVLVELCWNGKKDRVDGTSYVPLKNGEPIQKEISYDRIRQAKLYWKGSVQFYTAHGMDIMLDVWEKTGV